MAKMTLKLPDDLADRLSNLQKHSDTLVKKALEEGKISPVRYENYKLLYGELKQKRRY